ncbi:hypothetical protein TrVE_jg11298 [Triparma verrucosa]|uniref:5'-3' DNA helicase ZGRF1-like N-terminal domain-containing protein n=1 Tax=Triparma verrucosa TaxID=1606542 RepID=A0A9W7ERV6_9STRA|nr:hypothetical protein TrVE_jg11298 [Triparma verrucosa]
MPVRTLIALFTHQKNRKKKVFDDGFVKVNTVSGEATLHKDLYKQPIDTADLSKGELAELLSLSGDSIEFPKHLVECDTEYWPAGRQAPQGAAVGVPQKIDTAPAKQKITQRKISVVKKLTSKKFVRPTKFIPKSNAVHGAKQEVNQSSSSAGGIVGRRAPLQPGELRRQIYGSSAVPSIAPLVPSRQQQQQNYFPAQSQDQHQNQSLGSVQQSRAPPPAYEGIDDSDSDSDDDDDDDGTTNNANPYSAAQSSAALSSAPSHLSDSFTNSNPKPSTLPQSNHFTTTAEKENQETYNNPPPPDDPSAFAIKVNNDNDSFSSSSSDEDNANLWM